MKRRPGLPAIVASAAVTGTLRLFVTNGVAPPAFEFTRIIGTYPG